MAIAWEMSDAARALADAGFVVADQGHELRGRVLEKAYASLDDETVLERITSAGLTVMTDESDRVFGALTDGSTVVYMHLDPGATGFASAVAVAVSEYAAAESDPDDALLARVANASERPLPDGRIGVIATLAGVTDTSGAWKIHSRLIDRAEAFLSDGAFASPLPALARPADTLTRLILDAAERPYRDVYKVYETVMNDPDLVTRAFALDRIPMGTWEASTRPVKARRPNLERDPWARPA